MKILFTGASGFLGKNIIPLLKKNYDVVTLGRSVENDIVVDLEKDAPTFIEKFDVILHAAGKAHMVPRNKKEQMSFTRVNVCGTENLCQALEKSGLPRHFIFISTVAVYGLEKGLNINEKHPLNGTSPYALSKIKAEEFLKKWCYKNNILLIILRPSLIAGPNAPGNLGAMVNGIKSGKYFSIAGGKAQKSVLQAEDMANLIDRIVSEKKEGIYNVSDNMHPSFRQLESVIANQLGEPLPKNIPFWIAKIIAKIGDLAGEKAPLNSQKLSKITDSLTFDSTKAIHELNWKPLNVIENYKIV